MNELDTQTEPESSLSLLNKKKHHLHFDHWFHPLVILSPP